MAEYYCYHFENRINEDFFKSLNFLQILIYYKIECAKRSYAKNEKSYEKTWNQGGLHHVATKSQ